MSGWESDDEDSFHSADEGEESGREAGVVRPGRNEHKEGAVEGPSEERVVDVPKLDLGTSDGWEVDDWDVEEESLMTPEAEMIPHISHSDEESERNTREPRSGRVELHLRAKSAERPSTLWGDWNTILSASLNTITEGFSSVLETVESGLGAPTPEDLARLSLNERVELSKKADEIKEPWPSEDKDDCDSAEEVMSEGGSSDLAPLSDEASSGYQSDDRSREADAREPSAIGELISGVSSVFETTGKTLVSGSLDVLESLGKKTFDVLTETDADTKRKRFILTPKRTNLSQVLKELKLRNEVSDPEEGDDGGGVSNFALLFEEYQGMISLEALELLSGNCERQLNARFKCLSEPQKKLVAEVWTDMERAFDAQESDSLTESSEQCFAEAIQKEVKQLNLDFRADKLCEVQRKHHRYLDETQRLQESGQRREAKEVLQKGLECLAELTACSVEAVLKVAQLLLVASQPSSPDTLRRLVDVICTEIGTFSGRFSSCLSTAADDSPDPDSVDPMFATLFLEVNNSSSYVRDGLRLLAPVVKLAILQTM